jgi:hypothetical protein
MGQGPKLTSYFLDDFERPGRCRSLVWPEILDGQHDVLNASSSTGVTINKMLLVQINFDTTLKKGSSIFVRASMLSWDGNSSARVVSNGQCRQCKNSGWVLLQT